VPGLCSLVAAKDCWTFPALKITGLHNAANALAALALGGAVGLPTAAMIDALVSFPGLPHRSEWIADAAECATSMTPRAPTWVAAIAAVAGMPGPLVMIAGGEGKGQDFTPLGPAFRGKVRHAVLIGKDAPAVAAALAGVLHHGRTVASSKRPWRHRGADCAGGGYRGCMSPACASLDMFRDYGHRGDGVCRRGPRARGGGPA